MDKKYDPSLLRSVLQSAQNGLPLLSLIREHRELTGQDIPFRALGHNSLESFLRTIPDIVNIRPHQGEIRVFAVADDTTQHIASLVARQRSAKTNKSKLKKPIRRPINYTNYSGFYKPVVNNFRPFFVGQNSQYRQPAYPSRPMYSSQPSSFSTQSYIYSAHQPPAAPFVRPQAPSIRPQELPVRPLAPPVRPQEPPVRPQAPPVRPQEPAVRPQEPAKAKPRQHVSLPLYKPPHQTQALARTGYLKSVIVKPDKPAHAESNSTYREQHTHRANYERGASPTPSAPSTVSRIPPKHVTPLPPSLAPSLPSVGRGRTKARPELPNSVERMQSLAQSRLSAALSLENRYPSSNEQKPKVDEELRRRTSIKEISERKTYRELLEDYVQLEKMGLLVFKTFPMWSNSQRVHMATVTVKDRTFSSYPHPASTKEEAEELAAKDAITRLSNMDKDHVKTTNRRTVSSDLNNILIRVREIIDQHPSGVIHTHVPKEYTAKHNEDLPDRWLNLMIENEMIKTHKIDATRTILYPFVDRMTNGNTTSETSSSSGSSPALLQRNNSIEIELPAEDVVDVFITYVMSTMDVAFRLIDHSELYETMSNSMDLHYMERRNCIHVEKPREGHVYAAKVDESWHRVKVISITKEDTESATAFCNFIDHGDNDSISHANLYHLAHEFQELPHQALHCQLSGLESYSDNRKMLVILLEMLLAKPLVAAINDRNNVSLTLYDTSNDEDVNLNEKAIQVFSESVMMEKFQIGNSFHGYLSHVTLDGSIYIQPKDDSLCSLMDALDLVQEFCEEPMLDYYPPLKAGKLYLARDDDEKKWNRVVVVEDDGSTAIKCSLQSVPADPKLEWTEKASNYLWDLAGKGIQLVVKVVAAGSGDNGLPDVELFVRTGPANLMVSVNQTMAEDRSLFRQRARIETTTSSRASESSSGSASPVATSRTSSPLVTPRASSPLVTPRASSSEPEDPARSAIVTPELPNVGEMVELDVVLPANPGYFVCHPRKYGYAFDVLTEGMQAYYGDELNRKQVRCEEVKKRDVYAVFHGDYKMWYRVLMRSRQADSACVQYIDFGDEKVVKCSEVYHLPQKFQELPFQAVICNLSGIRALHHDWEVEDVLRFKYLVGEKAFMALINRKGVNSNGLVELSLQLFDVTTKVDIDIGQILVNEGRALSTVARLNNNK